MTCLFRNCRMLALVGFALVTVSCRDKVALGQQERPAKYESLFQQAKALEPLFFSYDIAHACYLLPR